MRTLTLTLAYDGTDYVGWQRQAAGRSVQGEIEAALAEIEGQPVVAHGAGRTDAGVHALAQVASVRLGHPIAPTTLVRALNAKLPLDIRVLDVVPAPPGFHARYAARRKHYRYTLATGAVASPFARRYCWHVAVPLDLAAMQAAADALRGCHDFAAFAAAGKTVASTRRTLERVTVTAGAPVLDPVGDRAPATPPRLGGVVVIDVVGDGFLRHMVRIIVGTLVAVGTGRRSPDALPAILASGRREAAGPTAPPQGLFLVGVDY